MNPHPGAWAYPTTARNDVDGFEPPWADFSSFFASRPGSDTYLIAVNEGSSQRSEWSTDQWRTAVNALADRLHSRHGVGVGDHMATLAGNTPEALAMAFAVWLLGACLIPLDPNDSDDRHQEILQHSGARWIGVDPGERHALRARNHSTVETILISDILTDPRHPPRAAGTVLPAASLDTPALRIHTSGTTGNPKIIVLTMRGILLNCAAMQEAFGWGPSTRVLTVLPINHVNGLLINNFLAWYAGGSTVLWEKFRSPTFWSVAEETQATTSSLVPTILEFLLAEEPGDRPEHFFEEVISGSGPLRLETASEFERRFGVPVRQLYGLSETSAVLTVTPTGGTGALESRLRGSVGTVVPHAEVEVVREDGFRCGEGESGEIVARGGMIMAGYAGDDGANATAFKDGWFHTGDRGHWRHGPDGKAWFFVEGRIRESILRGGLTIAPQTIDAVAASHPRVLKAAAFPFANRWYGEEIGLFVIADGDLSEAEILDWCAQRLDRPMCPKLAIFGSEMPLTRTGKLRRGVLAEQLAHQLTAHWNDSFRTASPLPGPRRAPRNDAPTNGERP